MGQLLAIWFVSYRRTPVPPLTIIACSFLRRICVNLTGSMDARVVRQSPLRWGMPSIDAPSCMSEGVERETRVRLSVLRGLPVEMGAMGPTLSAGASRRKGGGRLAYAIPAQT